ncbi:MAG: HRDC domain-containing protein, partial [Deltaproteobacteria bacterium]|nr:HRDC domain-containing protein [Deltaproteobacteria bacterium]
MSSAARQANQETFIREEGVIVVATIAFGMGIDKPNVRFVAHLDLPKSIEAYYQETGRAGRDGLPSTAWLAYGLSDIVVMRQMIESSDSDESRKRVERNKLLELLAFADSADCRRHILLRHFGEEPPLTCANCDNCLNPPNVWDGTVAAQKALSCVYRTGQRFGALHLADVLIGAESEKIKKFQHDKLSVFGIGKELSTEQWASVFRQLAASGYLETDVEGYSSFSLAPRAHELLQGKAKVFFRDEIRLVLPRGKGGKPSGSRPSASLPSGVDKTLLDRLKQKRLTLAKAQNLPPYIIFHDKTLLEMASVKPRSLDELSRISGVGEHKLARYGSAFLEILLDENAAL